MRENEIGFINQFVVVYGLLLLKYPNTNRTRTNRPTRGYLLGFNNNAI